MSLASGSCGSVGTVEGGSRPSTILRVANRLLLEIGSGSGSGPKYRSLPSVND